VVKLKVLDEQFKEVFPYWVCQKDKVHPRIWRGTFVEVKESIKDGDQRAYTCKYKD